jgi:hypothetical protein
MVVLPPVELNMPAVALTDLVHVIRSKNAGPTLLTLDLFFRDRHGYDRAIQSPQLSLASVAQLYGCAPARMSRYDMADLCAIKFTLPRKVCAGSPGDGDVYGAQQHGPLLRVML